MASNNIARLGIVLGIDTASFTADVDKAISENKKLKDAIKRDSNAAAAEILALEYATRDYGKQVSKVEQIERQIAAGRYQNAAPLHLQQLRAQAKAYDDVANSTRNATAAQFKMNEQQKLALTYQTTDLFTQIASGQSPFIALIQQGGQLKDQMGGVGNAFAAIRSVLTPTVLGVGAVASAFGILGFAAYKGKDELDKLKDTLTLTGNYAGITTEKFYKLSDELSNRTNASLGMTKDALNAVVASGKFTATSISAVTQSVITYAQIAGVDAKVAADKLMSGLDGTASGARSLNKEMNFLTLEQYKQIEALEKNGKRQEAAQLAAVAFNTQMAAQRRELGLLEKSWEDLTNGLSKFWNMLKEIGKPETSDQVIAKIESHIAAAQKALEGANQDSPFYQKQQAGIAKLKEEREALLEVERIKARSKAARDVGDSKARIEDDVENASTRIQKASELAKAKASAEYAAAVRGANEIEQANLEISKKAADAYAEMKEKNEKEFGKFAEQNQQIYQQKVIEIAQQGAAKLTAIKSKARAAEIAAMTDEEQKQKDMNNAFAQMEATKRQAALDKTKSLEFDKEDLALRKQMLYASEKEIKLAELQLKYKRLKEADSSNIDQLKRQEELERFNIEVQDSMKKSQQVFDSVWGNMSSAIDNFVKTGKLSMKDFARSVIQDLIAIELKAQAISLLRMMFGGNPLAQSSYSASGGITEHVFNPAGKASGGPVSGNTPYLVGEKGPELFMPAGSGTIVPNSQTSQMGAVTNVTNNYINAIDTKSFEERLLGSSSAIWAANKYGEKSLATTYGRT